MWKPLDMERKWWVEAGHEWPPKVAVSADTDSFDCIRLLFCTLVMLRLYCKPHVGTPTTRPGHNEAAPDML